MDRLYHRYADPFSFINGYLRTGRFAEFVSEFLKHTENEREETASWEVWLHKVFDGSYNDFRQGVKDTNQNQQTTPEQIETTINESQNILKNFKPS